MKFSSRAAAVVISAALYQTQAVGQPPALAVPKAEKTALKTQELGDMGSVRVYRDIYLAGQPSPEDLAMLKQRGFKTVISVRKADEVPWDEAVEVRKQAMTFVHVPFHGKDQLTPQVFDDVLKVLRNKKRCPILFHCGSANRVGAIWYAYRVLDGKLKPAEALAEAEQVGLRTPAYLEIARSYVEKDRKSSAAESQPIEGAP